MIGTSARRDFDDRVVDPEAGEGRQQVLDGGDPRLALAQGRAEHACRRRSRRGLDVHHGRQVRAAEDDALVRRRRAQGHQHLLARVQADAGGANRVLERPLTDHADRFLQ